MKIIIRRTFYILLTLIALLCALILLALQSSPHIKAVHQIDANFAAQNQKVLQRIMHTIKSKEQPVLLSITQHEIDGLSALGHRAIPKLISNIILIEGQGYFRFSLELPLPKLIRFLNIEIILNASQTGLNLDTAYIGSIAIPGNWLIALAEVASNTYIKKEFGTSLVNIVSNIDISPASLHVTMQMPERLNNNNKSAKETLFALRDQLALFGNVDDIRFYHQSLLNFIANNNESHSSSNSAIKSEINSVTNMATSPNKKSLTPYIAHLFSVAKKRSALSGSQAGTQAVIENRAALTALVLYFGTNKFELFIGNISHYSSKQTLQRQQLQSSVTLRSRVDIQKHFIYSIALQLFSSSTASDAIGELKEFLDSNQGGSGFSFADLMADRAGTRLAMISTQSSNSALLVQEHLANINSESAIIPTLEKLPEGISQQAFKEHYQGIKSKDYIAMLKHIDEQLLQIPLYQIQ